MHASVGSVAISRDGKRIAGGSCDGDIQVWDMQAGEALGAPLWGTGKELGAPLQGHANRIHSATISPDGTHIVSSSADSTIRVWDAASGKELGTPIRGHTGVVSSVAISLRGKWIVSGSVDKSIRVWDLESLHKDHRFTTTKICFSPNLTYALCLKSTFSRLEGSYTLASLGPSEEGWVIGPEGRLLLWIPTSLYPVMHVPGNKLVISNDASELDLSRFSHGTSWEMCRERDVVSSSS